MKSKTKPAKKIVTVDSTETSKTKPKTKSNLTKDNVALNALWKAFNSDIQDTELFDRYTRFNENAEMYKERHNSLVLVINEKLGTLQTLKQSILDQAMQGILASEAISKVKDLEKEIESLKTDISDFREKLEHNKNLAKSYKETSDHRMFVWWKAFKAVDPKNTPSWIDWKTKYSENII